jgi:hypothetical protein
MVADLDVSGNLQMEFSHPAAEMGGSHQAVQIFFLADSLIDPIKGG